MTADVTCGLNNMQESFCSVSGNACITPASCNSSCVFPPLPSPVALLPALSNAASNQGAVVQADGSVTFAAHTYMHYTSPTATSVNGQGFSITVNVQPLASSGG